MNVSDQIQRAIIRASVNRILWGAPLWVSVVALIVVLILGSMK